MTPTMGPAPLAIRAMGRTAAASPLRYPGGKAALAGFFAESHRSAAYSARHVRRTLCGWRGAGVVLLRQDAVQQLVINDADPAVHCFWVSVAGQPGPVRGQDRWTLRWT